MTQENKTVVQLVRSVFDLPEKDIRTYSPLTLAYIGDSIYDLLIRTMLVERGNSQVHKLHLRASAFVKASAQKEIMAVIEPVLSEEELGYFKRGRNAKSFTSAKNATISEYRVATGFEAMLGYLYLTDQMERILELVRMGVDAVKPGPNRPLLNKKPQKKICEAEEERRAVPECETQE